MKITFNGIKKYVYAAVVIVAAVMTVACSPSYKSVKRMQKMEEGVGNPTTKEEYEEAIKKYEKRAMDLVSTESQVGIWYKILGTRYLDQRMYGKALTAFQTAISYYPDNANLYYYIGVCGGYMANASLDFNATGSTTDKFNYLKLSEQGYLRALELDPKYYRAMYGIGVLYVFELDQSAKAIPYLETFLATQTKDTDGMFVLARAYYTNYEFDKAIELYDKIVKINPNKEKVAEAQKDKQIVLDAQYSK
jgi:tetratricopeptide (TPR) repeat protein